MTTMLVFAIVYLFVWGYLILLGIQTLGHELRLIRETLQTFSNQFQHFLKFGK